MAQPTNVFMKSKDAISARLAECFVTIGDRRYNFMQIINFEAKIDKTKSKVPRLGTIMIGHKSVAQEGTYSGKAHYNQSVMRECLAEFKRTGEDTYFEIQVTNDDPASAAQRQTIVFYDCLTDGGTLAKFDADSEYGYARNWSAESRKPSLVMIGSQAFRTLILTRPKKVWCIAPLPPIPSLETFKQKER